MPPIHGTAATASSSLTTVVVFGASGDLAKKKTLPCLFGLFRMGLLPQNARVVGYARSKLELDDFKARTRSFIKIERAEEAKKLDEFLELLTYVAGAYDEDAPFRHLDAHIKKDEAAFEETNRLFYLALPPSVFIPVAQKIRAHLMDINGYKRVIVEKPFGHDSASSNALSAALGELFEEAQIYRIDHYLGKEMVKNLMTLRFANVIFGAVWNRAQISNVQITFKEPFGVEGRGGYFDQFGIVRDVMQNHLLQILSLVAMEKPYSLDPEAIRDEKVKVLRCIRPLTLDDVVLGQYGRSLDGSKPGYHDDQGVPAASKTPTYALAAFYINNERWDGVPFLLKCGKALNDKKAEIRIQFRLPPGDVIGDLAHNELIIRVQPDEAVYFKIMAKKPGLSAENVITELDLSYRQRFTGHVIPDAYESLILDTLRGDHSNFVRTDELQAAWAIFTPLLHRVDAGDAEVETYPYGSRGPEAADRFVRNVGRYQRDDRYEWQAPPVGSV